MRRAKVITGAPCPIVVDGDGLTAIATVKGELPPRCGSVTGQRC